MQAYGSVSLTEVVKVRNSKGISKLPLIQLIITIKMKYFSLCLSYQVKSESYERPERDLRLV